MCVENVSPVDVKICKSAVFNKWEGQNVCNMAICLHFLSFAFKMSIIAIGLVQKRKVFKGSDINGGSGGGLELQYFFLQDMSSFDKEPRPTV